MWRGQMSSFEWMRPEWRETYQNLRRGKMDARRANALLKLLQAELEFFDGIGAKGRARHERQIQRNAVLDRRVRTEDRLILTAKKRSGGL
jgi:hypothetical protein